MAISGASAKKQAKVGAQKVATPRDKLLSKSTDRRRRKLSEATKARISAAHKARWAKSRKKVGLGKPLEPTDGTT